MKTIALEQTTLTVKQLAKLAKQEPVVLTQNGEPLATIRDVSGSDWDSVSLAQNPRFVALIEESRRSYREHGGTSLKDLRKELGLPAKVKKQSKRKKKKSGLATKRSKAAPSK